MTHPLDDEDVLVTVILEHVPLQVRVEKHQVTLSDDGESVTAVIDKVAAQAMDSLLSEIETR